MMAAKAAFWTGLTGVCVMILYALIGGAAYPGYSHATQYLSELGAIDAPHGQLIGWGGFFLFGILIILFAVTACFALPKGQRPFLGFLGITYYAIGSVQAAFFPCDPGCRGPEPSVSQIIHNLIGGTGYLAGLIGLIILGIAARKWDGGRHLAILGVGGGVIGLLAFSALDPAFEYVGVAQRILEACINVWILACAFYVRNLPAR